MERGGGGGGGGLLADTIYLGFTWNTKLDKGIQNEIHHRASEYFVNPFFYGSCGQSTICDRLGRVKLNHTTMRLQ